MATKKTRTKKKSSAAPRRPAKKAAARKAVAKVRKRARPSPPGRAGPVNKWMELRRSGIHGLGAFAVQDIPKGQKIIEYKGEKISNAEADRRYDDDAMNEHHTFLFILSTRTCVDAAFDGNEARFINHSCGPNAETSVSGSRIWITAVKRIPAGTEIVYDYMYEDDPKYTEKDYAFYGCMCGAPNCRGTIVKTRKNWRK